MAVKHGISEVLRHSIGRGYIHPEYFPTIMDASRRFTGKSMEKAVRAEVDRHMVFNGLAEDIGESGLKGEDGFYFGFMHYTNNFWAKVDPELPGGYQKVWMENKGGLDASLGPGIRAARAKAKENPKLYHMVPKTVAERRTLRQFMGDINRALEETETSLKEYRDIIFSKKAHSPENTARLGRLLFPAYVRLREWGYSHEDLQ